MRVLVRVVDLLSIIDVDILGRQLKGLGENDTATRRHAGLLATDHHRHHAGKVLAKIDIEGSEFALLSR